MATATRQAVIVALGIIVAGALIAGAVIVTDPETKTETVEVPVTGRNEGTPTPCENFQLATGFLAGLQGEFSGISPQSSIMSAATDPHDDDPLELLADIDGQLVTTQRLGSLLSACLDFAE